jgi:Inhibitor of apoptosis-promoting Bax1
VIDAATTTAAITLAAGAYGATRRRDLAKLGGILFVGLIGVLVAALLGLFIHLPLLHLGISVVAAALFTGFLVYDFDRLANTAMASAGDVIMRKGIESSQRLGRHRWVVERSLAGSQLRVRSVLKGTLIATSWQRLCYFHAQSFQW